MKKLQYCVVILLLILVFYIWFHRKPKIYVNYLMERNYLLSPAYGTVSRILQLADNRILITIFLSPWDIHHQYYPCDGNVLEQIYDNNGKYAIARDAYKSDENEKVITVMTDARGSVVKITQIAGMLVRRIVTANKIGKSVMQGEYLGVIRLGSRVDIEFSLADYELEGNIKVGSELNGPHSRIAVKKIK